MDVLSDAVLALRVGRPYATLTDVDPPWAMAFSAFSGARFHVVLQGSCDVLRTGSPSIPMTPGDAVLFPHGEAHSLRSTGGGHVQLLCGAYLLDRAPAHPLVHDLPAALVVPARAGRVGVRPAVDMLKEELAQQVSGHEIALPALLDVLLVRLIRVWSQAPERSGTGWATGPDDPVIAPALLAIHERPQEPWTVVSLGSLAGVSRSAFARRFTDVIGLPPLTYLTWWRLTTGARLLRTTDSPLTAVAERTGYGSPYAFANAFKRQYGVSPGQYRRRRRDDRDHLEDWAIGDGPTPRSPAVEA